VQAALHSAKQKSGLFFAHTQKAIFKFLKRALIAFARRRNFQLPARSISWTGRAGGIYNASKKGALKNEKLREADAHTYAHTTQLRQIARPLVRAPSFQNNIAAWLPNI
jgi:hypothetical protein